MPRVYVVSEDPPRLQIQSFLEERGIEVTGSADILEDFVKAAPGLEADTIIANAYTQGVMSLVEAVSQVRVQRPDIRVILLFSKGDPEAQKVQSALSSHQVFDWTVGDDIEAYGEDLLALVRQGRSYGDVAKRLLSAFPMSRKDQEDEAPREPEAERPNPLVKTAQSILSRRHVLTGKRDAPGRPPDGPDALPKGRPVERIPPKVERSPKKPSLRRRRALFEARKAAGAADIPKLVVFMGAVPRCGVSSATLAWGFAAASASGKKVCLIDGHPDRAALSVVATGAATEAGWDRAASPKGALSHMIRLDEGLSILPLSWNTASHQDGRDLIDHLPMALEAARLHGAEHVAVDLGSFPPLLDGPVDPRLSWALTTAGVVGVLASYDLVGLEAAARVLRAVEHAGPARVVVMAGRTPEETAGAAAAIGGLVGEEVKETLTIPHVDGLQSTMGQNLPPFRLPAGLREEEVPVEEVQ